jgi:PadR family transcriptional regulator, regulatory protein PadR
MNTSELIKGTLGPIIINLLSENGKMYGYEITQKVKELTKDKILIKEGSLYPALHKLLSEEIVEVETVNIGKRVRKYYYLTEKGNQKKIEQLQELKNFLETIKSLVFPDLKLQF